MEREAFTFLGISVRWYGILIALGMLAGVYVMSAREKRYGLQKDTALSLALWVLPASLLFARLYYVAFEWAYYAQHPIEILYVREGGLAIYGGILGGVAAGVVFARVKRERVSVLADLVAPGLALGQAIGRWGNFINQEAYGRATTLAFFPAAVYINEQGGWYLATFFYESIWCFLLCAAILWAEKKRRFVKSGDAALWYVLLYAAERCAVEGLRTDSLYFLGIRVSQAFSAACLTLCAAYFARRADRNGLLSAILALGAALTLITVLSPDAPFFATAVFCAILLILGVAAYRGERAEIKA